MQPLGASSLIQSSVPGDTGRWRALLRAPRLDALVRRTDGGTVLLDHYHRPQGRPDRGWTRGATLTEGSVAPAALAQLPDRWTPRWRPGVMVALVPEPGRVTAWTHDPAADAVQWRRVADLGPGEGVALTTQAGTLHALVRHDQIVRHWVSLDAATWQGGAPVGAAAGTPALLASGGGLLAALPHHDHVHLLTGRPGRGWESLGHIPAASDAPALAPLSRGRAVLAVPEPGVGLAWWQGPATETAWTPMLAAVPDLAAHLHVAAVALCATSLGGGVDASRLGLGAINLGGTRQAVGRRDGWLQALVADEEAIVLWHREQRGSPGDHRDARWVPAAALRVHLGTPPPRAAQASRKVAQVSGETDSQPWAQAPRTTLSRSDSVSGVRGTDLGVRVDVGDSAVMLFGDTHWHRGRWATRDSLALIRDPGDDHPAFEFHGGPLRFRGLGTTMTEYDVPLDGFTHEGRWYVFTSSNHFARHQVMGRSLLARADDPVSAITGATRRPFRFTALAQVSDLYFINVAVQPLARESAQVPFADGAPLFGLWGSGSYRADDLRFAVLDASQGLAQPRLAYLSGLDAGVPAWSAHESDAMALVRGSFGEVSVRWVPALASYALLSMSGPEDSAGGSIVLRTSPTPWGPWSERRVLFDWIADGLSFGDPSRRFIRAFEQDDPVGDAIFAAQAGRPGGAYAPYLYDSAVVPGGVRLRYTLSTWNPYQVVLMEHLLTPDDLAALDVPRG